MSGQEIHVRHLDLSRPPQAASAESGSGILAVYWWDRLPLGTALLSPDEWPQSPATHAQLTACFAAEQRAARDPALGAPLAAGLPPHPPSALTLAAALSVSNTLEWLGRLTGSAQPGAQQLSVIVCSRDRGDQLATCIEAILAQAEPPGELIVVDNSANGGAASLCQRWPGVTYVHEPQPGLSLARNAGVRAATRELIAFTDDDVTPHPLWTSEVVRALTETSAEAVTGLVLPRRLDTPAQQYFQLMMGGFGEGFRPVLYDSRFVGETLAKGMPVWRIGAGANMAFKRSVFDRIGLFDPRLGAGASGCSEDSEFWYRILATGGACFYEPRAVVFHGHREDWKSLERQIDAYMRGHVSALVVQWDQFGHRGNLARIFGQIPRYFAETLVKAIKGPPASRLRILRCEVGGWLAGLRYLFAPGWRALAPQWPRGRLSEPAGQKPAAY